VENRRVTEQEWTVVIPLKASTRAKSRLELPPAERRTWARAFATDTVAVAVDCAAVRHVVVVADEDEWGGDLHPRADVLVAAASLNQAIRRAAVPYTGPVAVIPGDLPALRASHLAAALKQAGSRRGAVLADQRGAGTVLLTAPDGDALHPAFGPSSYAAHLLGGAQGLRDGGWPGLRCDVDTVTDLAEALRLGVGPATSAAARR
jgi:2-phospho-L-lactate guanylyltransferase